MEHAKKDRDPAKARKRAKSDARCALKKLDLLQALAEWNSDGAKRSALQTASLVEHLIVVLEVTERDA